MKKIAIIAVTIAAVVPSLYFGIDTTETIKQDQRDAMLRERFVSWCSANGYNLAAVSENESEVLWLDVWAETDDYQEAQDSIDRVLREREINYLFND